MDGTGGIEEVGEDCRAESLTHREGLLSPEC